MINCAKIAILLLKYFVKKYINNNWIAMNKPIKYIVTQFIC